MLDLAEPFSGRESTENTRACLETCDIWLVLVDTNLGLPS